MTEIWNLTPEDDRAPVPLVVRGSATFADSMEFDFVTLVAEDFDVFLIKRPGFDLWEILH